MALPDNQSENFGTNRAQSADEVLQNITKDLRALQQDLVVQLTQDIGRLQTEKSRLMTEIDHLKNQYELLQTQHQAALSRQQVAQQQLLAKHLAQALAAHIQKLFNQQGAVLQSQYAANGPNLEGASAVSLPAAASLEQYNGRATQLLSSLDTTLNSTLRSLEQDLETYESSLSQQLSRMHSLEKQGETILEALVNRLNQQLQTEIDRAHTAQNVAFENGHAIADSHTTANLGAASQPLDPQFATPAANSPQAQSTPPISGQSPIANQPLMRSQIRKPAAPPPQASPSVLQRGMILILISTVALSLHNVVVGLIGFGGNIFGQFPFDDLIQLNFQNAVLVLSLRMLIVVPALSLVATYLYPPVWQDIRSAVKDRQFKVLAPVIGSAIFLFLSQILIYMAIPMIGPGVAVTILFMYPLVTVPMAWLLFGDRPTWLRVVVMFAIVAGIVLASLPKLTLSDQASPVGIITAVCSGIAFAFYLLFMQISFRKLHPVPVSLIQFSAIFVFASLFTIFRPGDIESANIRGLIVAIVILGLLTLVGYLLNNFGVRLMGAARASIIASSGPIVTALLAYFISPTPEASLASVQIMGIVLVTLAVAGLSFERMLITKQKPKNA
ncbi:MAG: EamA family transporter [Thainema sp.]